MAGTAGAGLKVGTTGGGLACGLVTGGRGVGRVTVDCLTFKIPGTDFGKDFADTEL